MKPPPFSGMDLYICRSQICQTDHSDYAIPQPAVTDSPPQRNTPFCSTRLRRSKPKMLAKLISLRASLYVCVIECLISVLAVMWCWYSCRLSLLLFVTEIKGSECFTYDAKYGCVNNIKQKATLKTYNRPGETTSVLHKCQNCNPASLGPPHPHTDIFIHMTVAKN